MKVAFLIPSTTRKRKWRKMEDTYLYNLFGKSFLNTITDKFEYTIYINVDADDPIYSQKRENDKFKTLIGEKADVIFISDGGIAKGFLTCMWNFLFSKAYNDRNEYFYQCGDDIYFHNKGWLDECVKILQEQNNIGTCGPINPPHYHILTQTLVSRKHMEIFNCYFPSQIKNWWCDNWINYVYSPHYVKKIEHLIAENKGGEPRYLRLNTRENNIFRQICLQLTAQGKKQIQEYLTRS